MLNFLNSATTLSGNAGHTAASKPNVCTPECTNLVRVVPSNARRHVEKCKPHRVLIGVQFFFLSTSVLAPREGLVWRPYGHAEYR